MEEIGVNFLGGGDKWEEHWGNRCIILKVEKLVLTRVYL